jgi:hypothetical protein
MNDVGLIANKVHWQDWSENVFYTNWNTFNNIVVYCINICNNRISCYVLLLPDIPMLTHRLKKTERMFMSMFYRSLSLSYIFLHTWGVYNRHKCGVLVLISCYWNRLSERCKDVLPHSKTLCCGVNQDNVIHLSSSQEKNAIRLRASQVDI